MKNGLSPIIVSERHRAQDGLQTTLTIVVERFGL
jgi:hypothetical protein